MDSINDTTPPTNYALNGKIMLCSVIILFIVIFFVVFFHSYSRWHGGTTVGGGVNEGGECFEDREVQTLR